jgi:c-di-GMP-binding flagellar brake protein YcgR
MAVSALVIDDGELQDVRDVLGRLGVEYRWIRPDDARGVPCESPSRLLITTARHALQTEPLAGPAGARPVRIAVLDDEARAACTQLRERGFDYLVRRPVHPIALQLLLLRTLYRGDERRVSTRIPIGCPTSYRTTFRRRPALLADLSRGGCRFYAAKLFEPDSEIRIQLPKELTGGEAVELPGWVVRCERDPLGGELPYCTALAFELLSDEIDEQLRAVLEARARGPERLAASDAEQAWREWSEQAGARRARPAEALNAEPRGARRMPRRTFRSRIAAVTPRDRALRTLVGRNISAGGMLLDPESDLRVGERLALALFGKPGQRLDVHARVMRNDREQGLALSFDPMSAEVARELERLIAGLPSGEGAEAEDSVVMVVSEITRRYRGVRGLPMA